MVATIDCHPNAGKIKTESISDLLSWPKFSSALEFLGEYHFLINLWVFNCYTEENLHIGEVKYLSVHISPEEMNILLYVKIPGGRFQTGEDYSVAGSK